MKLNNLYDLEQELLSMHGSRKNIGLILGVSPSRVVDVFNYGNPHNIKKLSTIEEYARKLNLPFDKLKLIFLQVKRGDKKRDRQEREKYFDKLAEITPTTKTILDLRSVLQDKQKMFDFYADYKITRRALKQVLYGTQIISSELTIRRYAQALNMPFLEFRKILQTAKQDIALNQKAKFKKRIEKRLSLMQNRIEKEAFKNRNLLLIQEKLKEQQRDFQELTSGMFRTLSISNNSASA